MSNKKRLDTIKKEVLIIVRNAYDMSDLSDEEVMSQKPWHDWDTDPEELTRYIADRFGLDSFFLDGETYKKIADIISIIDKTWNGVTLNDVLEIGLTENKTKSESKEYVNHPDYGNQPIKSGNSITLNEIYEANSAYSTEKIFPETVIPGNIKIQKFSQYGERKLFVDVEIKCTKCKRKFIFFALEHKHLAETLGFHVKLGPCFCFECRKDLESVKDAMKVYTDMINLYPRTNEQQQALNEALGFLFEAGYHQWA